MFDRKRSWIYRNLVWFVFVCSGFSRLREAESKCTKGVFKKIDGSNLTTMLLSTHHVKHLPYCAKHCNTNKCVGLKYRSPINHQPNCEVLKAMGICNQSTSGNESEGDTWQFYEVVRDKPSRPCSEANVCKNNATCVEEQCPSKDFKCVCHGNFTGRFCDEVNGTFASCEELLQIDSDFPNGAYNIQINRTDTYTGVTKAYCQMTSLEGCAGGGWTMVMKVNGYKKTFEYQSPYWSNKLSYNPIGGTSGFDDVETKLPTYWSTSFNELCIGMKVGDNLRFLTIPYAGQSLYSLIADGKFRETKLGRKKWKSLLADASLQRNCNKEGFNSRSPSGQHASVRIGIRSNEQNDCDSSDSFLGIGAKHSSSCRFDQSPLPTSGNFGSCMPDNGKKNIKSMGYILVR